MKYNKSFPRLLGASLCIIAANGAALAKSGSVGGSRPVVPKIAASAPPISLGALIYEALPHGRLAWDSLQVPQVRWVTSGIATYPGGQYYREGWARVRVHNVASQLLRQNWVELAWRVELESEGSLKWGPQKLSIGPGGFGDLSCFGVEAKGCTFASDAFDDPRMSVKLVCIAGPGSVRYRVFNVRARDGRLATLSHVLDAGSGGETDHIEITTEPANDICSKINAKYGAPL